MTTQHFLFIYSWRKTAKKEIPVVPVYLLYSSIYSIVQPFKQPLLLSRSQKKMLQLYLRLLQSAGTSESLQYC